MNTYMKVGERYIARKMSKYGGFSGPYFPPVFGLNTRKYGPEETPYLDVSRSANYMELFYMLSISIS